MYKIVTTPGRCWPLHLATLLSRIAPRGKGTIPRLIGRAAARWIDDALITRHGALLPILPEALDVFVTMVQQESSWDYWVLRAIDRLAVPGAVVYDVGANVGYLAVELAHKRRAEEIRVIAFEPNSGLARNIERAIELNRLDNLQVMEAALGAERGEVQFNLMPHSIHSSVVSEAGGARGVIRVRQETIDALVEEGTFPPPDILKIDVEGYEYAVLQGARRTLQRHHPYVIFEISDLTGNLIASVQEFETLFRGIGGYRICDLRGVPVDLSSFHLKRGTHRDLMAVPDAGGCASGVVDGRK